MAKASARHILVESEEKCNELKQQIADGANFADVAREHSSCPSSAQGGDLGSFGRGAMVPEFDQVVFSAPIGEVQGPSVKLRSMSTSTGISTRRAIVRR